MDKLLNKLNKEIGIRDMTKEKRDLPYGEKCTNKEIMKYF